MWILGVTILLGVSVFLLGTWGWTGCERMGTRDAGAARSVTLSLSPAGPGWGAEQVGS